MHQYGDRLLFYIICVPQCCTAAWVRSPLYCFCWPFWTLPFLPDGCSCPQAVPQPHPFPLLAPHGCSHMVIPTGSPQQTRCCGGSEEWPGLTLPCPVLPAQQWCLADPRRSVRQWVYRAVSTEHSLHSLSSAGIVRRHNQRDRAWGRSRGHPGHPRRESGMAAVPAAHRGGCSSEDLPSLLFSDGFFFFPSFYSSLIFPKSNTQHDKYCKPPVVSNCPWQHHFVQVTLSQHPLCNKCNLGQSFLGQHSLITMHLMISILLILMLLMP